MAKVGSLIGVAQIDLANAAVGPFAVRGAYDAAKLSTDVWAVGDRLYWDDTNKRLDKSAVVGQLAAVALEVTANPSSTGNALLVGPAPGLLEGAQAAEADLTAITGGESPTEAEHNLVITKMNNLLAKLRILGLIAP